MTNVQITQDAVTVVATTDPVQVKAGGQAAVDAHNQDAAAHPDISASPVWNGESSKTTVASSGTSFTADLATAAVHDVTLTASPVSVSLAYTGGDTTKAWTLGLILRQDATGGRTVTWPASVKWRDGVVPTLSTAANAVDVFEFQSVDGGTTWLASRIDAAGIPHSLLAAKGDLIAATGPAAATNLPLGTNGQVLTVDTAQAAGVKWAAAAAGGGATRKMHAGGVYFSVMRSKSIHISVPNTDGYTHAVPIWLPSITVANIGINVVTAAGATTFDARLGIYHSTSGGIPGSLLIDAGVVSLLTTGVKSLSVNVAVEAGLYWLVLAAQNVTGFTSYPVVPGVNETNHPEIPVGSFANLGAHAGFIYAPNITGALPATFPFTLGDYGQNAPIIGVGV